LTEQKFLIKNKKYIEKYYKNSGWLFLSKKFRVPYIVGSLCRDMTVKNKSLFIW
jgi:hypothetical protein